MKISNWILASILACTCVSASAQESKKEEPKGKAIVQVFGNFHSGFGHDNNDRGFELDRSYLGYQYDLGKGLQIKGVMDIGQSNDVNDYHRYHFPVSGTIVEMNKIPAERSFLPRKRKMQYWYL